MLLNSNNKINFIYQMFSNMINMQNYLIYYNNNNKINNNNKNPK